MLEKENKYGVCVMCITFNQAQYIEETFNGFCIQQTKFPFVCVIVDDASTDREPEVIAKYLEQYFNLNDISTVRREDTDDYKMVFARHRENLNCYFAVYFLKYNHYSIKKSKKKYFSGWRDTAKYVAVCEGDDYWIDSYKLQKQFDFMEAHPECTMCFHANKQLNPSGIMVIHRPSIVKEYYSAEDAIRGGGGFMATNSTFMRSDYLKHEDIPAFWRNCPIGDLPSMLYYASKGKIGYINDVMSVYRRMAQGSWTSTHKSLKARTKHIKAIRKMYDEYDYYTNFRYHKAICDRKSVINKNFIKFVIRSLYNNYIKK